LVDGATLIGAQRGSLGDAVVFTSSQVSIDSGCEPAGARLRATKRATKVKARFTSCAGVRGAVQLTATIDARTCSKLTGALQARRSKKSKKVRGRFKARRQGLPSFQASAFVEAPLTQATVGPDGGTIAVNDPASPLYGLAIVVPPGAATENVTFAVSHADVTGETGLPPGAASASKLVRISVTGSETFNVYRRFNAPVRVTLPYIPPAEGEDTVRFYVLNGDGSLEAAGFTGQDLANKTVTFLMSVFADAAPVSRFTAVAADDPGPVPAQTTGVPLTTLIAVGTRLLPVGGNDTGFRPSVNGWPITNFGSYYQRSRGGSCLGFVGGAKHYFRRRYTPVLSQSYRDPNKTPSILDDAVAIEYTSRVHNGMGELWVNYQFTEPLGGLLARDHRVDRLARRTDRDHDLDAGQERRRPLREGARRRR
jgi:hypothetical protein